METPIEEENTDQFNCVPHFDPGLLSLNILWTLEGLQPKDLAMNTWIDGPFEFRLCVVWSDAAATRLTNNRITMWCKFCTIALFENIPENKADNTIQNDDLTFDNFLDVSLVSALPGKKRSSTTDRRITRIVDEKNGPPTIQSQKRFLLLLNNMFFCCVLFIVHSLTKLEYIAKKKHFLVVICENQIDFDRRIA